MYSIIKRVAAVVVSAAMLTAAAGCGAPAVDAAAPVATPAILLTAHTPERGDMALSTAFVGSVSPDQVVGVIPKLSGIVEKVHVTVGQQVKKGDLLMTLDSEDIMPSYNQAEAAYNSAKAQTEQMTGSSYKSSLANLDASYDSAYDKYEEAQYQLDKLESQKKNLPGEITAMEAEKAKDPNPPWTVEQEAELKGLIETYKSLPISISMAEDGLSMSRKYFNNARSSYNAMKTEGEVELQNIADATITQAEAGLNIAKQQLENTKLYAPIDGVVESVSVTELNAVSPSAPAFVIANKSAIAVTFSASSAAVLSMQVGDIVTVEKGQNKYNASITEVGTIINAKTGLFDVKAAIENAGGDLLTGVMVKVSADTQKAENALLVSQDSLYYDDGKPYVYVMADGANGEKIAKKTFVETGISNPEQIEVISGISESDMIITSWHPNLIDGVVVTLATDPASEPAADSAAVPVVAPSSASASQEG